MRRSLLAAAADQALCHINPSIICTLRACCDVQETASIPQLLSWRLQQQYCRQVRTKAQPGLTTHSHVQLNADPATAAADAGDEHANAQHLQKQRQQYLQDSSRSRGWQQHDGANTHARPPATYLRQNPQQSRPGMPSSSSSNSIRAKWKQDPPLNYDSQQLLLQQNSNSNWQRSQQQLSSTVPKWRRQQQQQEHWQQQRPNTKGRSSRYREGAGRTDVDAPSSASAGTWKSRGKQSAAVATAGPGTVWHVMQQSSSSSSSSKDNSSSVPTRQPRVCSQSALEIALQSTTGITPALLTQAISSSSDLPQLQLLLTKHKDRLQQINICAAFKAVVRLAAGSLRPQSSSGSSSGGGGAVSLSIMRCLAAHMQEQIRVARPWDLAQAAWACSKLQYRDAKLLDAIAQQVQRKAPILLPQDIAQLASAYARLGCQHLQLMQLLQQHAIRQAAGFKPWSLIHTAWALQVSGTDPKPLLHAIAQHLQPDQLAGLQSLDVATLLWLMAAHGVRDVTLLTAVQKQLTAEIASYPPPATAQALISLAGLGVMDQELAQTAAPVVLQDLQQQQQQQDTPDQLQPGNTPRRQYSPQHVTHATFALVQMGQSSQQLLDAAAAVFLQNPSGYAPGLLCMLCWAFPLAGRTPPEKFMQTLIEQCMLQLDKFTADQLASILRGTWALAAAHTTTTSSSSSSSQLIAAACRRMPQQLHHMSTPVLVKLITTLAKQCRGSPGEQFTVPHGSSSSSSSSAATTQQQQQQQQQQQLLLVLLQQCGVEWLQQHRLREGHKQQHRCVQQALRLAGLTEVAAAAAAAQAELAAAAAASQMSLQASADPDAAAAATAVNSESLGLGPAGGAAVGSWVDNFVATTDDATAMQHP